MFFAREKSLMSKRQSFMKVYQNMATTGCGHRRLYSCFMASGPLLKFDITVFIENFYISNKITKMILEYLFNGWVQYAF